jgi:lysophospholipase L1-like esterase
MDILFIGDSIIEGSIGVNFLPIIAREKPELNLLNYGLNGDTLPGIRMRLLQILRQGQQFDCILMEGGHNDLLMSSWMHEGDGQVEQLAQLLEKTIREVKAVHKGQLVLATLSCLGEDLESEPNRQRRILNQAIIELGKKHQCKIADVGKAFDEELRVKDEEDDFLHLTIDGVHINKKGAALYAGEIIKCLP